MRIIYDGIINKEEESLIRALSIECGISFETARLLYSRKIDSVDKIKKFLNPNKDGFINPFLLTGMDNAVERINLAVSQKQNVLIFGDYDADGVCATSVLYYCLKRAGLIARCIIPEREDGYGLNIDKIIALNNDKKIDLLITVDCGISDKDKVEEIKKLGIDVIVTDHHEPPEELPNCITINPKIPGQEYGFTELCGAGVAYKLGKAFLGDEADDFLDFVALATVSDSMDLIGENRNIVSEGLKIFNSPKLRNCFSYLLGDNDKSITSQTLAYSIAPKVNAGGRMGDANSALRLFLSESIADTSSLSELLKVYNVNRQIACDDIYKQAKELAISTGAVKNPVIMVYNKEWKTGFIGIAAARLVEEYSKPVIVFAETSGVLKGSARSVDGINIHEVISSSKDILESFGGHSQAAGVSVKEENFALLNKQINNYVNEKYKSFVFDKKIHVEWLVEGKFSKRFAKEIELLGPFGVGNKRPIFATEVYSVNAGPLRANSPHYSFTTETLEMLNFNGEKDVENLRLPIKKTILFETNVSVFRNKESVKGFVKNVILDYSFDKLSPHIFLNEINKIRKNEEFVPVVKPLSELTLDSKDEVEYVVSNPKTLSLFPKLKEKATLFNAENGSNSPYVVVSAREINKNVNKVVYIDVPYIYLRTNADIYVNNNACGYDIINEISTDRSIMTEVYNILRSNCGKEFNNSVEFYYKNVKDYNIYQFIFGFETFLELGIFKIINGILRQDSSVVNPLSNSKIYNHICKLKA